MKNRLLCWILSILGFSTMASCDAFQNGSVEYGTPHVKFTVKGVVTDEEQNPIKGIKIEIFTYDMGYAEGNTVTLSSGSYTIQESSMSPPGKNGVTVVATDIDGEENGLFQGAEKTVYPEFTGSSGGWYSGEATETVDFVLLKAEPENEVEDGDADEMENV